ncbi:DUF4177 domain-containing protein [bacterium]|nr:DUF4177 domain-containing protein [bacterium]
MKTPKLAALLHVAVIVICTLSSAAIFAQGRDANPEIERGAYQEYYEALKKKYDELVEQSSKKTSEAYDWVNEDYQKMFSWEYKVVSLPVRELSSNTLKKKSGFFHGGLFGAKKGEEHNPGASTGAPGDLEALLNKEGEERWELVQVVPAGDSVQVIFKRPPKSYLKKLPLRDLFRLLPGQNY